jgi:hypothetical protein
LSPSGRRERPAGRRRVGWFVYLCVRTIVSIYVSFQLSDVCTRHLCSMTK